MTNRLTKKTPDKDITVPSSHSSSFSNFRPFRWPDILWHVSKVSNYMTTFCPVFIILSASVFFLLFAHTLTRIRTHLAISFSLSLSLSVSVSLCLCLSLFIRGKGEGISIKFFLLFFLSVSRLLSFCLQICGSLRQVGTLMEPLNSRKVELIGFHISITTRNYPARQIITLMNCFQFKLITICVFEFIKRSLIDLEI